MTEPSDHTRKDDYDVELDDSDGSEAGDGTHADDRADDQDIVEEEVIAMVEEEEKPRSTKKSSKRDDNAERELAIIRPAMFRAHPFRYIFIVVVFVGGLFLGLGSGPMESLSDWLTWPGFILAVVALGFWGQWWFVSHLSRKLRVTNKRTIHRIGFLSRSTSEVMHQHIRNIKIDQTVFERILNTGRLRIDSSAGGDDEGGVEIEMFDVPRPHELKEMIDEYRSM